MWDGSIVGTKHQNTGKKIILEMPNIEKWANILWKPCSIHTASFLSIFSDFSTLCIEGLNADIHTAQKIKFSIKEKVFYQIRSFIVTWSSD